MRAEPASNKTSLAKSLNISRSTLYYRHLKPTNDWILKTKIEAVLRLFPSYGSRRIAISLKLNRKRIKRVMNLYGIKPYRRRTKKWIKPKKETSSYPNLLITEYPSYENHIWVSDFTYLSWKNKPIYLSTVLDIFSRRIVGINVLTNHTTDLVSGALLSAIYSNPIPKIFHSDNGSEFDSDEFKTMINNLGILISRSKKGCPWENGYQESFYDKFKVDLSDPNRFNSLGELVFGIYKTIHTYNNKRIHSALKMSPIEFIESQKVDRNSV